MNYDLDQIKKKGKSKAEKNIEKETKKIEKETFDTAKQARIKLQKAEQKQKKTSDEIRMQNEKLDQARKEGIKTYKNVKKAEDQAVELEKGANVFDPLKGAKAKVSKWENQNYDEEQEMKNIENKTKLKIKSEETNVSKRPKIEKGDKNELNSELAKILQSTRNIAKETKIQSKLGEKQEVKLKDISKTIKYSDERAKKADERLKKNL